MMEDDWDILDKTNPFECPLCFEKYNTGKNIPTTLVCGHSLCLYHIETIRACVSCHQIIPPVKEHKPNFSLRDGSLLYHQLLNRTKSSSSTPSNESAKINEPDITTKEDFLNLMDRIELDDDMRRINQLEQDEILARAVQVVWADKVEDRPPQLSKSECDLPTHPSEVHSNFIDNINLGNRATIKKKPGLSLFHNILTKKQTKLKCDPASCLTKR